MDGALTIRQMRLKPVLLQERGKNVAKTPQQRGRTGGRQIGTIVKLADQAPLSRGSSLPRRSSALKSSKPPTCVSPI